MSDANALARDGAERQRALDPSASFIVQAPAGSGKTELLVQRLLALLATIDEPEAILAITFTRKAAQEMRERLIGALAQAAMPESDAASAVERARRRMALPVLLRDRERGWRLLEQPGRLLIETFDAFCARIVRRARLTLTASEGALGDVGEMNELLYREAARRALSATDIAKDAGAVLATAGNQFEHVTTLLANLLGRRAQWLAGAIDLSDGAIAALSAALRRAAEDAMSVIDTHRAVLDGGDIAALAAFAADVLERETSNARQRQRGARWRTLAAAWPLRTTLADVPGWVALADMLLTSAKSAWRKPTGINKGAGFPTASDASFADLPAELRKARKAQMIDLIERLQGHDALAACLAEVEHIPSLVALAEHEKALRATLAVLRRAAMELVVLMRERGVTDFSGVMTAALTALRDNRFDVLANFDAQLQHVLVDEVQDTNPAQFELLAALCAPWSEGDGRTLFLVGDPMQSIYLFRDADVSLFRRAQRSGVGPVRLQAVTLSANYRSQPAVVAWINRSLATVFAQRGQGLFADTDSVAFVAAVPTHASGDDEGQSALDATSAEAEALAVVDAIAWRRRTNPEHTIAVLVRTRGDAEALIAELRGRNIAFTAREFSLWSARERVRDLLTLTDAVAAPWDRLALFALLRTPWVGLKLATLAQLAAALTEGPAAPAWQMLDGAWVGALDDDERARVARAHAALRVGLARAWLGGVSERVEAVWHALDGPRFLADDEERRDTDTFFAWLAELSPQGLLPSRETVAAALEQKRRSFTGPAPSGRSGVAQIELMTIHKAKGLEWDHVYLVGCDRRVRADARSLAAWRFQALPGGRDEREPARSFAVAARDTRRKAAGSVYDFIARCNEVSRLDESKRLLYVAVTRARRTLTLSRQAAHRNPPRGSFAAWLGWSAVAEGDAPTKSATSRRLLLNASLTRAPAPPPLDSTRIEWPAYAAAVADAELAVPEGARLARALGTVGHLLFEGLALSMRHASGAQTARFAPSPTAIAAALLDAGASADDGAAHADVDAVAARLGQWFSSAMARANVRFLFASEHRESAQELGLAGEGVERVRVDHTFVTAAGERWIVDYKFSEPPANANANELAAWLAQQRQQHAPQLERYRRAVEAAPGGARAGTIITALYFPWIDRLERCDVQRPD
ncbi:MAG: UvrD-helicase domain-containing protein [Burkholderiales bacterium]|nr:UvrD-helicase domain-containing protein [Burkholderiales bacterium]